MITHYKNVILKFLNYTLERYGRINIYVHFNGILYHIFYNFIHGCNTFIFVKNFYFLNHLMLYNI